MSELAKRFNAEIIKNTGDCLILYYPKTSSMQDSSAFSDVVDCGIAMIESRCLINSRLYGEKLPPISYRISADYGKFEIGRLRNSPYPIDLFGTTMNICSKINSLASPNSMVIGSDLYEIFSSQSFPSDSCGHGHHSRLHVCRHRQYCFEEIGEYSVGLKHSYPVYIVVHQQPA